MTRIDLTQFDSQGDSMASRNVFNVLAASVAEGCSARLGRLALAGKRVIDTPNFMPVTSRGAVPHLTPDNVRKHVPFSSSYMALEDFIEQKEPPIYSMPGQRPLHGFTATPQDMLTVLGPRRVPAVATPGGNAAKSISVFTSSGFYNVSLAEYAAAAQKLRPDVLVPLADLPHTSTSLSTKKLVRMVERTEDWLDDLLRRLTEDDLSATAIFAPILPAPLSRQWDYLRHLAEDVRGSLSGLAVYDADRLPDLVDYSPLTSLPKLCLQPPKSPLEVLRQVSLGVDICTLPFINSVSDAGIAMTFQFPPLESSAPAQPLGANMWSPEHATALEPLQPGCQCHACSTHHRAFLQHLLNAKEMLGWTLLQIHNHHVVSRFFAGIRRTLAEEPAEFERRVQQFNAAYETDFPEGTGERPRARGYHFKSEASAPKINKSQWQDLGSERRNGTGTLVVPPPRPDAI